MKYIQIKKKKLDRFIFHKQIRDLQCSIIMLTRAVFNSIIGPRSKKCAYLPIQPLTGIKM
jgi:hypothetical protein